MKPCSIQADESYFTTDIKPFKSQKYRGFLIFKIFKQS